jgi:hypothetical protein
MLAKIFVTARTLCASDASLASFWNDSLGRDFFIGHFSDCVSDLRRGTPATPSLSIQEHRQRNFTDYKTEGHRQQRELGKEGLGSRDT